MPPPKVFHYSPQISSLDLENEILAAAASNDPW